MTVLLGTVKPCPPQRFSSNVGTKRITINNTAAAAISPLLLLREGLSVLFTDSIISLSAAPMASMSLSVFTVRGPPFSGIL